MSFLAPFGLVLGLLALPLAALYFLKLRRRKVVVPSLMLWEALAEEERRARPFDKFKRNILLWLQLLFLLLATLAFARLAIPGMGVAGKSLVVVIDTSASMAATDTGSSRLDTAVAEAMGAIDSLAASDEVAIITAGSRTRVLSEFSTNRAQAKAALTTLTPSHTRGTLRAGLQLALSLAQSRPDAIIQVYSDGSQSSYLDIDPAGTIVRYKKVGRNVGNASILALDLRSAPGAELDKQAFTTVQWFGPGTSKASIEVYLDDKLIGLRNETLADDPVSMVFDLPAGAEGTLHVKLRADDDHLALDNDAWAVVAPIRKRKIALVGSDLLTAKILTKDPRVELSTLAASTATSASLENFDAVFLADPVNADLTGIPTAYLKPSAGGPAPFAGNAGRPQVLDWDRTHPTLRFVTFQGLQIRSARAFKNNGALKPIVDSTLGPLILAGERNTARVIQLAFDPLQSDLPLRVAWPVFVLNSVGWLTEQGAGLAAGSVIDAGDPWTLRVPVELTVDDVNVTGPQGSVTTHAVADRLLRVQNIDKTGIYTVRAGEVTTRFAANLHAAEEADLSPKLTLDLAESGDDEGAGQRASVAGATEVWRYLLLFGLLFLAIEWWVWSRRQAA